MSDFLQTPVPRFGLGRTVSACIGVVLATLSFAVPAHADSMIEGTYRLISPQSQMCLSGVDTDVSVTPLVNEFSGAGKPIIMAPCTRDEGNPDQLWVAKIDERNRQFYFRNRATRLCLTLVGRPDISGTRLSYNAGYPVSQDRCDNGPDQTQLWEEWGVSQRQLKAVRHNFCMTFGPGAFPRYVDCQPATGGQWLGLDLVRLGDATIPRGAGKPSRGIIRGVMTPTTFRGHDGPLQDISWSPDGSRIVSGGGGKSALVWNADTLQITARLTGHEMPDPVNGITAVAWSPDSKQIATGAVDGTARIWDAGTGRMKVVYREHLTNAYRGKAMITGLDWAPSGKMIASVSNNPGMAAAIWSPETGRRSGSINGFDTRDKRPFAVAWNPVSSRLAIGSADGVLRLWELSTGGMGRQIVSPPTGSTFSKVVSSVDWNPKGSHVVTASWDRFIRVWNRETGQLEYAVDVGGEGARIKVSPAGFYILVAGKGKNALIIDTLTGRTVATLSGHESPVTAVGWSPNGKYVVTGSRDRTVKVWPIDR